MGNLIDNAGLQVIQQTVDTVNQMAPFAQRQLLPNNPQRNPSLLRGYLMQPVSRGEQALVALTTRRPEYITFKIDLAGVIYLNHPDGDSSFKLQFLVDGDVWFEAPNPQSGLNLDSIPLSGLDITRFAEIISQSSVAVGQSGSPAIPVYCMRLALGHPTKHSSLVNNPDLYPAITQGTNPDSDGYIHSLIGSWIFSISRDCLPRNGFDFSARLLFSLDPDEPVQLNGPAVMTIHEIHDVPTYQFQIATDVMEVAQPTPLRGGTLVTLGYFEDIGYGIVAANPREYLFQLDYQ